MAEVSRVILNQGQTQTTLIDLQEDTATPDKVLYGYKFHQKNGEVKTGTYVQPTLGTKSITENGTYNASSDSLSGYSSVSVNVQPTLGTKNATTNGTYTASTDGFQGYSSVTVAVPNKAPGIVDGSVTSLTADDLSGITSIRNNAFFELSSLTSITIPNTVTSIGVHAFGSCTGLTSITIPDSVTSIGENCFQYCPGLTSITIGSGVKYLGDESFFNCRNVTSLNYNVEYLTSSLNSYSEIFTFLGMNGTGVDVTIGDNVQEIPSYLFYTNTSNEYPRIKTITIGYNVSTIGSYAFNGCAALTSITINASTVPALSNANAFNDTNNCPIYVPADMVSDYQSANVWSSLASRIQAIPV